APVTRDILTLSLHDALPIFHRVYAFIARRVRDRGEVEDLTAEVFHQALSNIRRFEWRGVPFAAWLLRIAANLLADRWQRASKIRSEEHTSELQSLTNLVCRP